MINTKHKDRLFCFIFGREENKKWTLSLYNAVNHSAHTDSDSIQITTMEDVLYMGMKNDVSFIIADTMSIYEQQSTYNPNMPVRELMYAAKLYDKYIHEHRLNIYSSALVHLPIPKLMVFYNGREECGDGILELKDAFQAGSKKSGGPEDDREENCAGDIPGKTEREEERPDIAVRVRMININHGQNKELLDACKPLAEYTWLIQRIQEYTEQMEIERAVEKAIDEMPEDYEIRTFLIGNRAEVKSMCITEYNEAETMRMFEEQYRMEGRMEGRKEGRKEGRMEGRQDQANEMAEKMLRAKEPIDKIILYTGLGKEDVDRLSKKMNMIFVQDTAEV